MVFPQTFLFLASGKIMDTETSLEYYSLGSKDLSHSLFSSTHTSLSHDVVFPPSIFLFNITLFYNPFLPLIFINFLVLMICNFLFRDVHCYHENSNTSNNMMSAQKYIHKIRQIVLWIQIYTYYNLVLRFKLLLFSTVKMWLMSSRAIHVHFISTV